MTLADVINDERVAIEMARKIIKAALSDKDGITGKACSECCAWKPLSDFGANFKGVGGRLSKCKECNKKLRGIKPKPINLKDIGGVVNKHCSSCEEWKPLEAFHISKNGSGGRYSQCKSCKLKTAEISRRAKGKQPRGISHKTWQDGELIQVIRDRYRRKEPLSRRDVPADIYQRAVRELGSWKEALNQADIPYEEVCVGIIHTNSWNSSKIISEIKNLSNENCELYSAYISSNHKSLYGAAVKYFGSWGNAVTASGIDYTEIRQDKYTLSYVGREFETVVGEILRDLNVGFIKYGNKRHIRPDFIIKNNIFIDAKLSEWSIHSCETVAKYTPHCKLLTIVYLRGSQDTDIKVDNKTRLLSVYKLIKQLPQVKQTLYKEKLNILEQRAQII